MLTPWHIYCDGERLRGVLKHSWLENQIENVTPEQAVKWLTSSDRWLAFDEVFPMRIGEARELGQHLDEMFSPVSLVDQCAAFGGLDRSTKELFKGAIHQAYLETSRIADLQKPLLFAVDRLEAALNDFRAKCDNPAPNSPNAGSESWRNVLTVACDLKAILECLPKGVVFP